MQPQVETKPVEQQQAAEKKDIPSKDNVQQTVQEAAKTEESDKEINWRKFKEAREADRKRAEESERQALKSQQEAAALKAALDAVLNKPSVQHGPIPPQYGNTYDQQEESEDQRIEKRIAEAIAKRDAVLEQQRRQHEKESFPSRLRQEFKDFDQVCSSDNLDYLDYHYPEVSAAFSALPDGFDKWSKVYKATKRFVPNTDSRKDQAKADKNFNKPQSISAPGPTQSTEAGMSFKLDEKRKNDNWARMQRTMNRVESK